jgi:hypothetical protein
MLAVTLRLDYRRGAPGDVVTSHEKAVKQMVCSLVEASNSRAPEFFKKQA